MNDQLMLRNYSPDAFNWLMICCLKDTNRRYNSNRKRCDLKKSAAKAMGRVDQWIHEDSCKCIWTAGLDNHQ